MKCYALALAGMALVSANPASLFKSSPEAHGINAEPLANLADGSSVQGRHDPLGQRVWRGIPYAQPPVGALRWEDPLPAPAFSGVYDANFQAPGCPQSCGLPNGSCPKSQSEDCLFLTVWSPPEPSTDPGGYPVLFWIHGGSFNQGVGDCPLYNGTSFASEGVVTVVFNYRLGVLGFLASESMEGNYGLKDQRLALQWTNDNIAGFGGDPRKVTIAGQSAGASSVAALMTMEPGPTGLFRAAIMASNPLALPMHTRPSAKTNADSFSAYVGCPMEDLVCLRAQAVDDILDAQRNSVPLDFSDFFINFLPFSPLVDAGGVLPVQPFEALAAGQFDPVPMLSGTALDEGWLFVRELFPSPVNPPAYRALFRVLFGADASDRVLQQYPFDLAGDAADGRATLNILASDLLFHCPLRNITRGYHQDPRKADTFMYLFNHAMSFNAWLPNNGYCYGYVCHGSELPFAFNVFTDGDETFETTEGELQLSRDMVRTWVNFVRNVDPNEGGAIPPTGYPLYDPVTDLVAVQDTPSFQVYAQYRSEFCDLWDALGYFY